MESFDKEKHRAWLRTEKRRNKIHNAVAWIFYGGIGIWLFNEASPEWQQSLFIMLVVAVAHWEIKQRIDTLIERIDQLEEKISKR